MRVHGKAPTRRCSAPIANGRSNATLPTASGGDTVRGRAQAGPQGAPRRLRPGLAALARGEAVVEQGGSLSPVLSLRDGGTVTLVWDPVDGADDYVVVLHDAALGELDRAIFQRPKSGFVLPIERWCRQQLREEVTATLGSAPTCRAVSRASGNSSSSGEPKPTLKVRIGWSMYWLANATMQLLSTPPLRNAPTSTSANRCDRTARSISDPILSRASAVDIGSGCTGGVNVQ